jgi:tripartite ATP-independent transporter DctP family solute receptor
MREEIMTILTLKPALSRRTAMKLALGTAANLSIAMPAIAQAKTTVLRFGGPMPLTTNYGQAMVRLSDEVGKRTDGRLSVQLFPNGQLGGLKEMTTAVQLGTQSMIMATPSWIGNYARQLDILTLVYLARSQEKMLAALDGSFGRKLAGFAEPAGFKIMAWWNGGPRHMFNNVRPINTPSDLAGLKMRSIANQVWLQSLRALGANPVTLDYPEIYLALQQHTVDGYENPAPDAVSGKFYEVCKYLSLTAHLYDVFFVAMNKRQWDRLSPKDQQAFEESAAIATKWQREAEATEVNQALDVLRSKMQVNDVSEPDRQAFREKMRPVYASFENEIGKDLFAEAVREFG